MDFSTVKGVEIPEGRVWAIHSVKDNKKTLLWRDASALKEISGTWELKNGINLWTENGGWVNISCNVDFNQSVDWGVDGSRYFTRLKVGSYNTGTAEEPRFIYGVIYLNDEGEILNGGSVDNEGNFTWLLPRYRVMSFMGKQLIPIDVYDWITTNANQISEEEYLYWNNPGGYMKIRPDFNVPSLADCGVTPIEYTLPSGKEYTQFWLNLTNRDVNDYYVYYRYNLMYDTTAKAFSFYDYGFDGCYNKADDYTIYPELEDEYTAFNIKSQWIPLDFYEWMLLNMKNVPSYSDPVLPDEMPNNK